MRTVQNPQQYMNFQNLLKQTQFQNTVNQMKKIMTQKLDVNDFTPIKNKLQKSQYNSFSQMIQGVKKPQAKQTETLQRDLYEKLNIRIDKIIEDKNERKVSQWTFRTGQMFDEEEYQSEDAMKLFHIPKKISLQTFESLEDTSSSKEICSTQSLDNNDFLVRKCLLVSEVTLLEQYLKKVYIESMKDVFKGEIKDRSKIMNYIESRYKGLNSTTLRLNPAKKSSMLDQFVIQKMLKSEILKKQEKHINKIKEIILKREIRKYKNFIRPHQRKLNNQLAYMEILKKNFVNRFHMNIYDYLKMIGVQMDYVIDQIVDEFFMLQSNKEIFIDINPFVRQLFIQNRYREIKEWIRNSQSDKDQK